MGREKVETVAEQLRTPPQDFSAGHQDVLLLRLRDVLGLTGSPLEDKRETNDDVYDFSSKNFSHLMKCLCWSHSLVFSRLHLIERRELGQRITLLELQSKHNTHVR